MNMETKLFLRGWCRHPIPLASVSMNKVRSDDDDIDDYNDAVNVWCQVLIDGGGAGGPFWRILVEYLILVLVEYLKMSDLGKFQIFWRLQHFARGPKRLFIHLFNPTETYVEEKVASNVYEHGACVSLGN